MKFFSLFLMIFPALFIIWMNATPGHFQWDGRGCGGVSYITNVEKEKNMDREMGIMHKCGIKSKTRQIYESFLTLISEIDLQK